MTVTITDSHIIVLHEGDFTDAEWDEAMHEHGIWHELVSFVDYGLEGDVHVWTFERG